MQDLDSRADLLRHQRANLPEHAEIVTLGRTVAALKNRIQDSRILVEDLTAEQQKADADVEQVRARRERDRDRMDRGLITNPKDLERMRHELVSLERRISVLEDQELEIMERLEEAQRGLAQLTDQLAAAETRMTELTARRDEAAARIDGDLAELAAERAPQAAGLPGDLLALYDRLRQAKGGVGAAVLRAGSCGGCRLSLDNAELAAIRSAPSDEVIRCEECQRILVRTGESGL